MENTLVFGTYVWDCIVDWRKDAAGALQMFMPGDRIRVDLDVTHAASHEVSPLKF